MKRAMKIIRVLILSLLMLHSGIFIPVRAGNGEAEGLETDFSAPRETSAAPSPGAKDGAEDDSPGVSTNINANTYYVTADVVRSYLYADGDTLVRVEYSGGELIVERYGGDTSFLSVGRFFRRKIS